MIIMNIALTMFIDPSVWYRHDIVRHFRQTLKDQNDIHARLMSVYAEVPHSWYAILGIGAFVLAVITIEIYDTKLPVWALVVALLLSLIFILPIGFIHAITNQTIGLNVLSELLIGYMLPGRPVAMMIFKTFSFISMNQALYFLGDLKLGHYMKVPPRIMFQAQIVATTISVVTVVLVQAWMFENIPDICTDTQSSRFICPGTSVFATASLIWGGIGPRRILSRGAL